MTVCASQKQSCNVHADLSVWPQSPHAWRDKWVRNRLGIMIYEIFRKNLREIY